jgi:Asp-tRNA(Asn)/Glu-tRNA(Gln) amidotransferase A subunit family amidase
VAGGLATPLTARQQVAPDPPERVDRDELRCAQDAFGVGFSDAERDLMQRGVNANLENAEIVRRMELPSSVEPAVTFSPPVTLPTGRATPGARLARSRTTLRVEVHARVEDLAYAPLTRLARLIEDRRVTSAALTRMFVDRLKRHDETLKCVVTLTEELALAQAAAADREIASGRYRGPLHGVPWGVKDLFSTKGIRTTWGAKPYEQQVFNIDATVVERLQMAGAVLLAKLTTGELAVGDLWFGGRTRNPWNPQRGSSGSSAGPASAVAAGLVGFGVGTETNGSIISPSNTCGVTGLRPTSGRVSRHGVMTLRWTLDKVGPICRRAEDCALVLNAIYGPDGHDRTVADVPFTWRPGLSISQLRIGLVTAEFEEPQGLSEEERKRWPARRGVQQRALETLRAAGANLEPVVLPDLPARAIYALLNAEAGAFFDELVRRGGHNELTGKGPNDRANQLRMSRMITAVDYLQAQRARSVLIDRLEHLFARYHVFVTPSQSSSTTMSNLTGHPAVSVNAGFVEGLPEGIMFTGRYYDEGTLLALAHAFEERRGDDGTRPVGYE